ncbi:MAG: hypothetical protein EBX50_21740 [Chitinophagia bacterium]|nr:hypothetical protein [Chitinophagia bacterium]
MQKNFNPKNKFREEIVNAQIKNYFYKQIIIMPVSQGTIKRRTMPPQIHQQNNRNIFDQSHQNNFNYQTQKIPQPSPYNNPYANNQFGGSDINQVQHFPYQNPQQNPNYLAQQQFAQQQQQLIQQNQNTLQLPQNGQGQLLRQQNIPPISQIIPPQSSQQITVLLESRIVDLESEIKQLKEQVELQQSTIHQLHQNQQSSNNGQEANNYLQKQFDGLKDTVMKLQTYTMEVNRQLLSLKQPDIYEQADDFEPPAVIHL